MISAQICSHPLTTQKFVFQEILFKIENTDLQNGQICHVDKGVVFNRFNLIIRYCSEK